MKIKNIEKAAERIRQAAASKESIIIYGDSDMDGIASVVILDEAIKNIGGNVVASVFPDREKDGYGVNMKALDFLKDKAPALFITLDLGIGNIKEIKKANELGFEVIVVDHHQPLDSLPEASIIVDPQQAGDEAGFKYLCNAGLTYKLVEEILKDEFSENLRTSFLELVALATISDMVPQIGDNKLYIEKGLKSLPKTFRPGLQSFLDIIGEGYVAAGGFMKIISALNASESINFENESYKLLTSSSYEECKDITERLIGKVRLKQEIIKNIVAEVEKRVNKNPEEIVFEGDPAWRLVLAGPVASIISQEFKKPTFIFKKESDESCGSVRLFSDSQNSVEAMKTCSDILITYGGHPKASGFRVKTKDLEEFKHRLIAYFMKHKT
ncbi:MAG: hypothetical protein A3D35_01760 [Candidatus Staskawiczbacteria bacterium RIFCSPHIGHO2_02_FULL_34_9]|uniref:DDH domain-containing protein n=1 Tax=Candidatus Staskawiczbacteria bacterium RIFCSPHIGHO2_02_FULL_34_9 TaxID=1802206 RepID=A0A1G2I5R0_9BACT|nr:MAG: hypothetical protein A3D35_01760 [Candidatus Staskawiczbacteria bacterium RIFCSPHIGHO2_02_FULL_34_9]